MKQQDVQAYQVTKIVKTFFKYSDAKLIRSNKEQKLIDLCKGARSIQFLLNLIAKSLNNCQKATVRLNIVTLFPSVLFSLDLELFFSQINTILCDYEQKINKSLGCIISNQKTEHYLRANVELPFIRFLKKGLRWKMQQSTTGSLQKIDQGFSYLNKVKYAFQLKIIFHNYSCYYPQHYYAFDMFRVVLLLISKWWNLICDIGKAIIKESIINNTVRDEDYLFLQEADRTQDLLVDFATVGSFAKKLQRNFKLKHINFMPAVILQLHNPLRIKILIKKEKQIIQESKNIKESDEDQMIILQGSEDINNSAYNSQKDRLESILTVSSIVQEDY